MDKVTVADTITKPVSQFVEPILNPIMERFPEKHQSKMVMIGAFVVIVLFGVVTGFALAKLSTTTGGATSSSAGVTTTKSVNSATEAGINDSAAFPDTAQGVLQTGGASGEGTHHLDRGMGANKDVYISSTVINLDNFVGKKVEIQGQTISGKKAGWLMDVGKIKIID